MLLLNISKCTVLFYTKKKNYLEFENNINESPLVRVDSITDLGVTMKSNLSFDIHIKGIISDAFRNLGFVMRQGIDFSNIDVLKILYTAYVWSMLEYAVVVWHPNIKKNIRQIEIIQSKFVRFLTYKRNSIIS